MTPQITASDVQEWRGWLKENHASASEVWLVFYKKSTGKPCPSYNEAVEEALCWGWIDGMKRSIDEERYAFRFSPRKEGSNWSPSNVKRAQKLLKEKGRIQPAGMRLIKEAKKRGAFESPHQVPGFDIHPDFEAALKANKNAGDFFNTLAPSHKKQYIGWISSAKRDETRQKRLKKALEMLETGQKLGMV